MLFRLEQMKKCDLPFTIAAADGSVSGSEVVNVGEEPSVGPVKQPDGDHTDENEVTGHAGQRAEVPKNDDEKEILVSCAPCWRELRRAREQG